MSVNYIVSKVLKIEPYLSKVAFGLLKNQADVEDVISETTLTIIHKYDQLKDKKFFKTWATRICINECYQHLKRLNRFVEMEEVESHDQPYFDLYKALEKLPTEMKTIVVLKYLVGYTFVEIAQIMDSSATSVQRLNKQALKQLRLELEDEQ